MEYTAGSNRTAGDVLTKGDLITIAYETTASGDNGAVLCYAPSPGIKVVKNSGEAWTIGDALYYDSGNDEFTVTAPGNALAGYAAQAAGSSATVGYLALNAWAGAAAQGQYFYLNKQMTLGSSATVYVNVGDAACTLVSAVSVVSGTTDTGPETLTLKNNAGTAVTGGTIVIASGSSAGDVDTTTAALSANNTFTANQNVQIATDGGNGQAVNSTLTLKFELA